MEIIAILRDKDTDENDRELLRQTLLDQARQEYAPQSTVSALEDNFQCSEQRLPMTPITLTKMALAVCGVKPWMAYWCCIDTTPTEHNPVILCARCVTSGRRCAKCPRMSSCISRPWSGVIAIVNEWYQGDKFAER